MTETPGPDVDTIVARQGDGPARELLGGLTGLPYSGLVRRLSGARERERACQAAVAGGMVRRGDLKGSRHGLACRAPVTVSAGAP